MAASRSQSSLPPTTSTAAAPTPVATIVAMVGKGMTVREIRTVFPELKRGDIRAALLKAADVVADEDVSLRQPSALSAWAIVERLRENADLAEDDAMKVAVEETLAYRREKAGQLK